MKTIIIILFSVGFIFNSNCTAQMNFPVRQLTFDRTQDGFATWSPDGKFIIYSRISRDTASGEIGLWKISLTDNKSEQIFHGIAEHPKWSPDGRFIVFDAEYGNDMKMITADGGSPINFLPDSIKIQNGGMPIWSPGGDRIAFLERNSLSLCIYDMKTHHVSSILREDGKLPMPGCWLPDGNMILVALMDRQTRKSTIVKVSADGGEKQQITGHLEGFYRHLAISPDGTLLIYAAIEEKYLGLHVMPAEGGKSIPLIVTHPGHNESPVWSPDGKQVAFTSTRSGNFDIWLMDIDAGQIRKDLLKLNKIEED